ncbi:hypothetical protein Glove_21g268 [Diversispora epigaea]|uniref:Galactose oxidase n=1 Tax=Diversispora epigaea TaxID=1348612 RepID=A0A397JKF7_9GLOM|nr:hypothetical protein Glove_21g268 [Diversispora epigaea]
MEFLNIKAFDTKKLRIISIYSFQSPNIYGHSTALIDKRLYFIGGYELATKDNSSFFYIDLNQSFDVSSPAYVPLEALPVGITWATACVGGANNVTIFVFGGINQNRTSKSQIIDKLINMFDTKSNEWSTLKNEGEPIRRRNVQAVIDNKGNMYIFGGGYLFDNYTEFFNDMIIFNTITLTYSNGSTINGPPSMFGYTATLLPNGIIMYIGGRTAVSTTISIKNITMYDVNDDSWNYTIAKSQNVIEDRSYHSAVLTIDGRIICYGGAGVKSLTFISISPSLIVLNTTSFEWRSPEYFSTNEPPKLYTHSANLVGNYMIIGFGNVTNVNSTSNITSSSIYLLDIRNYTWISYYEASLTSPSPSPSPAPSPAPSSSPSPVLDQHKPSLSAGAIVGITISAAIVLMLLLFFGIRYCRNRSPHFYIAGSQE